MRLKSRGMSSPQNPNQVSDLNSTSTLIAYMRSQLHLNIHTLLKFKFCQCVLYIPESMPKKANLTLGTSHYLFYSVMA